MQLLMLLLEQVCILLIENSSLLNLTPMGDPCGRPPWGSVTQWPSCAYKNLPVKALPHLLPRPYGHTLSFPKNLPMSVLVVALGAGLTRRRHNFIAMGRDDGM
jgi:hypothetical protein